MKIAIMQPYFLPYIGYWQLLHHVDHIVVYDRIQYTKKGWINRNRFLLNSREAIFTLPLLKAKTDICIAERTISPEFNPAGLLARFHGAYKRAPYFDSTMQLMERIIFTTERNLFSYIYNSIVEIMQYLGIKTCISISSELPDSITSAKGAEKVMAICNYLGASHYVNPLGGKQLYDKEPFRERGISLQFLHPIEMEYRQFSKNHVAWLSIVDILMFNSLDAVRSKMLGHYNID